MQESVLRAVIHGKLSAGRLPHDRIPRMWGGPGNGETCQACDEAITKTQFVMEGICSVDSALGVQLHVRCFQVWNELRQAPDRGAGGGPV